MLRFTLAVLTLNLDLSFSLSAVAEDSARSQIKAEIVRLQHSIKENPVTDKDLSAIAKMAENSVEAASAALDSGDMYLALEKVGQAEDLLQGARTAADKDAVEKGGLSAFQAQWGKTGSNPVGTPRF